MLGHTRKVPTRNILPKILTIPSLLKILVALLKPTST
jgi:hypothetical protein